MKRSEICCDDGFERSELFGDIFDRGLSQQGQQAVDVHRLHEDFASAHLQQLTDIGRGAAGDDADLNGQRFFADSAEHLSSPPIRQHQVQQDPPGPVRESRQRLLHGCRFC